MDLLSWALALAAGTLAGLLTGLVPGLHVNTLAAVALAALPAAGPAAAVALVAVGVVHAFVGTLPATYLGAAGEEHAVSALPAHRMLKGGEGPAAVRTSLDAALGALVAATALLLPYKWLVLEPGRLLRFADRATLWVVAGVLALLLWQEGRRGWRRLAWAALVLGASGLLGLAGGHLALRGFVDVPPSPLLPLLSGCFGAAGLLASASAGQEVVAQHPARRPPAAVARRVRLGAALGVAAAGWTAVASGLTSAVATAVARAGVRDEDPRPVLATLSAVNTAHVVLTFGILWMASRARTGLALATESLLPVERWDVGQPPLPMLWILATCLAAGLLGHAAALALDRPFSRLVPRLPPRPLALVPLAGLTLLVLLFTGWLGLLLYASAAALGLIPAATGIRRVHLTGSLLLPALAASL